MNDKTEQSVTDALRLTAKLAASYLTEAADTIENLREQLAEAQKYAERYLWMRDKETSEGWDIIGRSGTPDAIDAAIDAARGEKNGA